MTSIDYSHWKKQGTVNWPKYVFLRFWFIIKVESTISLKSLFEEALHYSKLSILTKISSIAKYCVCSSNA